MAKKTRKQLDNLAMSMFDKAFKLYLEGYMTLNDVDKIKNISVKVRNKLKK